METDWRTAVSRSRTAPPPPQSGPATNARRMSPWPGQEGAGRPRRRAKRGKWVWQKKARQPDPADADPHHGPSCDRTAFGRDSWRLPVHKPPHHASFGARNSCAPFVASLARPEADRRLARNASLADPLATRSHDWQLRHGPGFATRQQWAHWLAARAAPDPQRRYFVGTKRFFGGVIRCTRGRSHVGDMRRCGGVIHYRNAQSRGPACQRY
ncbi:hypothetical protein ZWY2020_009960 [Hordeum vulgare]|nr:hypothetical protein ZWY2020_009960 [Hordeum vulgare]